MFGCNGSGRISSRIYGSNISRSTTITAPQTNTRRGLLGLGISATTFICIAVMVIAGFIAIWVSQGNQNSPVTDPVEVRTKPVVSEANESSSAVNKPTDARNNDTETYPSLPDDYICNDISKVELFVGADAKCGETPVNVRFEPRVPSDSPSNAVYFLKVGEEFVVIGGPKCAHYGTWWQIRVASGIEGWVREYSNDYGRLILLITQ
jgi:hypothetical protein